MAKRKTMSKTELAALLDGQIADAIAYDESELAEHRELALEYIEGEMADAPAEEGKSSVVSYTVRDTISWILPGVMRVFLASDHVATYEPVEPGDEAFSGQATDLVNHVFLKECAGYKELHDALYDGFATGNGIVKHYWCDEDKTKVEEFSGLGEDVYTDIVSGDDIEVLEHTEHKKAGEYAEPYVVHDLKVRRTLQKGYLRVQALPTEDFLIEREATELDEDVRFVAHRDTPTRSELIARGYDRDIVEKLPAWTESTDDNADQSRDRMSYRDGSDDVDKSVERVRIFECYPLIDFDGDGIAERRLVVMADSGSTGNSDKASSRLILKNEEWPGDLPFTDLVPDPVPHRWRGRSIFDKTRDIQLITTVLQRQTLDNIYRTNNPQRVVQQGAIANMDALVNNEIGEVVIANRENAVQELAVPFVARQSFEVLQFYDDVLAKRTGVSAQSMGLDPEVLQNQTAQAVAQQQSASQSMVELYARNIAEVGLRRLFRCMLRLLVKHQDRPKTVRLRDEWVQMDPRAWNADMDVTVNVGLGAGSRDRDMAVLAQIMNVQEKIVTQLGTNNPLVGLGEIRNSFAKLIESAGMRSPEQYVREIDPQTTQQMGQEQQDPDAMAKQAELQMKAQEMQGKMALEREKMQGDLALKREQMDREMQLKREQLAAELELKRELAIAGAAMGSAATSPVHMGGAPG
ncbi:MAG: hypothetical protein ACE37E_01175 [Hyphomicrobiales bacterium]